MHFEATRKICILLGVLGVGGTTLMLGGCGGGSTTEGRNFAQNVEANKYGIVTTQLDENNGFVHINGTKQFHLIGIDKDGAEVDLTDTASWNISDNSLGSISKTGLFTPEGKAGELTLTAVFAGQSHSQPITISAADLVGISITNSANVVDVCQNLELTADALFNNGLVLEYPLTWRLTEASDNASFPNVNEPLLATHKSGAVTVIAEGKNNAGNVIESAPFGVVVADNLSDITLTSSTVATGSSIVLREGATTDISVNATYADNSTANITANAKLGVDGNAASIDSKTGKLTAVTGSYAGTEVTVTASCNNQTEDLLITIIKPEVRTIEIRNANGSAENVSLRAGNHTDLRVTATLEDSAGSDSDYNHNLEWRIDDSQSDNYDSSLITLDDNGRLSASSDLNLLQSLGLVIEVRVLDAEGDTMVNRIGEELIDTIVVNITN